MPRARIVTGALVTVVAVALLALVACGGGEAGSATAGEPAASAQTEPGEVETVTETEPAETETETEPAETETDTEPTETETETEPADEAVVVVIQAGEPVGGPARIEVRKGEKVRFRVEADEEQEIHVHGYELEKTAAPGSPAVFRFSADFDGVFEVESHLGDTVIARIVVEP